MTDKDFTNLYWKQFLMIEKEFRKAIQYVALSSENFETYSDFFAKILLQIGSEIDVVAKLLCKELNDSSTAVNINQYGAELLIVYPEIEAVTIICDDIRLNPWQGWGSQSLTWWKIYNGVKHNRGDVETYDGDTKENYKFANLRITLMALAALYILELYLFRKVTDADPHLDTPIPGSRLFKAIDCGWENKNAYNDSVFFISNGDLMQLVSDYMYSDL